MVKLLYTGKQYQITIPKDHIKRMKWKRFDELYITKDPEKDFLYIEKMPKQNNKSPSKRK